METKKERIERVIAEAIGKMTKGPYYVNRAMMRRKGNRPPKYVLTAEDYARLDQQRETERKKREARNLQRRK